jgi:GNAT superfamily N-acetyltransferase
MVGGRRLTLRLLEPSDSDLIRQFYWRLSPETIYRRFLGPVVPPADALVRQLTNIDHRHRDALIAIDALGIAGIARYAAFPGSTVHDLAVVVADDWQRHGLGGLLTRRLAHIARLRGISRFHATMSGDNHRAQSMVRRMSPRATLTFESGMVEAEIPLRR